MRILVTYLLLMLSATLADAQVSSDDSIIEGAILRQLLSTYSVPDKDIGVDKSEAQLKPLRGALGLDRNLMTIAAYLRRYPNPNGLGATCFWVKVTNRTPDAATAEGGDYPVLIKTKWGPMYRYTTDYKYNLMKLKGQWVIVSSRIIGES